ncbi:MAG: tRNA (adenosine(37)-N6)-threonylcarbamoyltransferase complex ATPase subunit type 1 TsaE [Spirochaetes bacterium]|nr:tRNA (adenosine(37)-N6)-threonylcarbamoyltransferase complex ATPase subunit type 1 TsaE [Spirochaetota bacterium]
MGSRYISNSFEETVRYGKALGDSLTGGEVLLLTGVLGSGKTALTKGIAESAGVREVVTSPSFTIMNEYSGRLLLYHFDFYRIDDEAEMEDLIGDFAYREDAIVVIEWGEKLKDRLDSFVLVNIALQNSERIITVTRRRA